TFVPGQARRPLRATDFPGNPLTSDISRFSRDTRTLEKAPELGLGGPTMGWLNAAINSIGSLSRLSKAEKLRTPVLFVTAGADKVVSTRAAFALAERVPGIAVVKIENARHELLNERNDLREQFWAAFDSFVDSAEVGAPREPQRLKAV
ncbi:MAG: alpha/beta hydrolase, partial [Aestuariivirgaceae bacterium]